MPPSSLFNLKALLRRGSTPSADEEKSIAEGDHLLRTMGPFSATMLITGMVIGSGIFSTPSSILTAVGSVGMSLMVWVIGGLVSYFGVLAYLELGCMLPKSGGEKEYLDVEYPRPKALMPFMFCINMIFLIRPGACAADSIVTGNYFLFAVDIKNDWISRGIGILVITSICIIHSLSVRWGLLIQNTLTGVKVITLILICVSGLVAAAGGIPNAPLTNNFENAFAHTSQNGNTYASALFKVFFAYDGWNNANYILDELKNPIKTLKISALSGITLVTVLYTIANVAYFIVVPRDDIIAATTVVAGEFFRRAFGGIAGERILPVLVGISAYGSVMCMTFTGGRVIMEAAKEGYLPFSDFFSTVSRFETPMNAFIIHWIMSMILMLAPPPGEAYTFIIDLTGYPSWIFYGASVIGLLLLRRNSPDLQRPFRSSNALNIIFIFACVLLAILPFAPPLTSKVNALPFWLYPTVAVAFILFSGGLWRIAIRGRVERDIKDTGSMVEMDEGYEVAGGTGDAARKG